MMVMRKFLRMGNQILHFACFLRFVLSFPRVFSEIRNGYINSNCWMMYLRKVLARLKRHSKSGSQYFHLKLIVCEKRGYNIEENTMIG